LASDSRFPKAALLGGFLQFLTFLGGLIELELDSVFSLAIF
jgi:hypothetical protein